METRACAAIVFSSRNCGTIGIAFHDCGCHMKGQNVRQPLKWLLYAGLPAVGQWTQDRIEPKFGFDIKC